MSEYAKTRHHLYLDVINDSKHLINKYSLICEVGAPDSVVAFIPVIGDDSIEDMASTPRAKLMGVEISTSIVTSGLVTLGLYKPDDPVVYYGFCSMF